MNTAKTRKEAKELNLLFYETGKQCKNGHIAHRRSDSGQCVECRSKWRTKQTEKYNGKTCKYGHDSVRYASGNCIQCRKEKANKINTSQINED